MSRIAAVIVSLFALAVGISGAQAQDTVKVGLILPYSGQFADAGIQIENGLKLYMSQHGDTVAGKKIEIIRKDVGGIAPDVAKRLAQELIVRDGVDMIAGFALTPNALAAGDVSAQAKKFMVVMNAATSIITTKSPYMVRTSLTIPQLEEAFGEWVAKNGTKTVYTMVSDYGPGHDAEQAFIRGYTKGGGKIVGSVRMPIANPDFSAFVQRAKDVSPEGIFIFVPGGAQPAALGKAMAERGIDPSNTKIMGQGEITMEKGLESLGDSALGIVTTFHYDVSHDSDLNRAFVKDYKAMFDRNPDLFSAGGYDGAHLIYEALKKTNGNTDAQALVDAAKGMAWESPRGPVSIDPETRDIIQTVYVREVQKVDGVLTNVEIAKIENVKDPVKEAMKK
ncbi:MAG: ABC transporter substrate-binding protein [Rhodobiaceae bacterium]|nr:ABC transporter substrate-binding protein [Rhodobiaceae bacterium]